MTVNSFTSVSLEPAWITVALRKATRTHSLIVRAGTFAVTILAAGQEHVSQRFAGQGDYQEDRFAGLETATLLTGAPLFGGGLAWLDCRVVQTVTAGENSLFVGEVLAARGEFLGQPLIYHHRQYWGLLAV